MKLLSLSINGEQIQGAGGMPTGGILTLEKIIQVGIIYFYIAAVILALFFLIWGGINYITSEGDKQKLAQARQKIVFALIGLIIAFLAYLIISIIGNFFGINLLGNMGNSRGRNGTPCNPRIETCPL